MNDKSLKPLVPIQSLVVALRILDALGKMRGPAALSEIARDARVSPSKLHRYLATLLSHGFVEQSRQTGRYSLGRGSISLGLRAMRHVDLYERVNAGLDDIARRTGCHSFMSIWTAAGPIVVRWSYSDDGIGVNTMPGQLMSVLRSSSGQIFAAFLPEIKTARLIQKEITAIGKDGEYARRLIARVDTVRTQRYSTTVGELEAHLQSIAVPVFDWHNDWLIAVGCTFDVEADNVRLDRTRKVLQDFAANTSAQPEIALAVE